jgi:hypothetical protein
MFDSRLMVNSSPRSSGVERLLGKEEVMSSNLIAGSIKVWFRSRPGTGHCEEE